MSLARFTLLVITFVVSPCLLAQYTAGKIIFEDAGPYEQADLEAVAQLHAHDKVGHDAVQAAVQRLIDTGYFDDVGATFDGPAAAIRITFTLKPLAAAQMTTVGYENFVWLTPEERDDAIHKAAPLFQGRLPAAGNQTEIIVAALQSVLAAKGTHVTIVHDELEPSMTQPERVIPFSVELPAILVHAISLRGIASDFAPQVQTVASKLRNTAYREGVARPTTADMLLLPYFNAGYVTAKLDNSDRRIAAATATQVDVDISGTVSAGEIYHVSSLMFPGTPIINADAVRTTAKLHPGDVASRKLLLETLRPIDEAYRHLGYMDVFVDSGAKLDSAAHTVAYNVTVKPGKQYRIKTVVTNGFTPVSQADFEKTWRMNAGSLYDPGYVTDFFKNNTAVKSLQGYSCGFRASADPQNHLVDLTLNCTQAKAPGSAVTFN